MFSKIDKQVIIVLIVLVVVAVLAGVMVYQYIAGSGPEIENTTGGATTDNNTDNTQIQISAPEIQVEAENGVGELIICLDECGNGVCQEKDLRCVEKTDMNCICPETPQDCPQDCP